MNFRNRVVSASSLFVVAAVVSTLAVGGAPAWADASGTMPSGCSITASSPTIVTGQKVHFHGKGSCSVAYSDFVRLVHNYDGLPDAQVTQRTAGGESFDLSGSTCDHGPAKTQYYTEAGWHTYGDIIGGTEWHTVQRDSPTKTLSHC